MTQIHASCVAFGKRGVLIRGPSGSGKSDLCLRLIDAEGVGPGNKKLRGILVADDQVSLKLKGKQLIASAPGRLSGLLEIRGKGIVRVPYKKSAAIALVVDLTDAKNIERMPGDVELHAALYGLSIPRVEIDASFASAAARVRAALW